MKSKEWLKVMAGNCDIVWYCSEIQRKYGVPSNIGCIIFSFFFHFAANSENFKCIRVQMNVQSLTLINMGWSIKKNIKQKNIYIIKDSDYVINCKEVLRNNYNKTTHVKNNKTNFHPFDSWIHKPYFDILHTFLPMTSIRRAHKA